MEKIKRKALQARAKNPRAFPGGVRFMMDNARFHAAARRELGIRCVDIPPQSSDCNKVVEHCLNRIKHAFWKRYAEEVKERQGWPVPFNVAKRVLKEVAPACVTPEIIRKDAATLRGTYHAIMAAGGGYVDSALS